MKTECIGSGLLAETERELKDNGAYVIFINAYEGRTACSENHFIIDFGPVYVKVRKDKYRFEGEKWMEQVNLWGIISQVGLPEDNMLTDIGH